MPRTFIPSGDYHYSDELKSWIWWEIWDDGNKYIHRWNQANNTTEWLDVPNKRWVWKADGKKVPADALAHYEANQTRDWNAHHYRDDNAYLDEPPLSWNGIELSYHWNRQGEREYWNGQGADPFEHNVPLGPTGSRDPERLRVLYDRRRAHQEYAYHLTQQAESEWTTGADGWPVHKSSKFSFPGGKKRVNKSRRVSNRRRRNKSIRRRKN
jgi:hypothetical protein